MLFKIIKLYGLFKTRIFKYKYNVGKKTSFGGLSKIVCGGGSNIRIGNHCSIHGRLIAGDINSKIIIGDFTTIRYKSDIMAIDKIIIGNHVVVSNNVIITDNDNHAVNPIQRKEMTMHPEYSLKWGWKLSKSKQVIINDNVWIGTRAIVLKGVEIGENSVVAAGSIVTKNIPPFSLCYGNPCMIKNDLYRIEK